MNLKRFKHREDGAAALEFALTAPIFIALLFGALQGALMFWTQLGLQHAVERAARCAAITASVCGTSDQIQAYAVSQGLATNGATFSLVPGQSCGRLVTASASVPFVTSTVNLTARSCFPDL